MRALWEQFATHKEGNWIMRYQNAETFYNFLLRTDVKDFLELGTGIGCSTALFGLAMQDKGVKDYTIHTVEQYEKCVVLAKELIPKETLEHTTIYQRDTTIWETDHAPYMYSQIFKDLPDVKWDVSLIDGPGPILEERNGIRYYVDLNNGDMFKLIVEGKIKPNAYIVWDGRIGALALIDRYLGENFYLVQSMKGKDYRFNIIQRKDNELKSADSRLEFMDKQGYFEGHVEPKSESDTRSASPQP